jgi:hypothetical protein
VGDGIYEVSGMNDGASMGLEIKDPEMTMTMITSFGIAI